MRFPLGQNVPLKRLAEKTPQRSSVRMRIPGFPALLLVAGPIGQKEGEIGAGTALTGRKVLSYPSVTVM